MNTAVTFKNTVTVYTTDRKMLLTKKSISVYVPVELLA